MMDELNHLLVVVIVILASVLGFTVGKAHTLSTIADELCMSKFGTELDYTVGSDKIYCMGHRNSPSYQGEYAGFEVFLTP